MATNSKLPLLTLICIIYAFLLVVYPVQAFHSSPTSSHARRSFDVKNKFPRAGRPFGRRDGLVGDVVGGVVGAVSDVTDAVSTVVGGIVGESSPYVSQCPLRLPSQMMALL